MNMITGIDRPTAGTVTVDGERIDEMSEGTSRSGAAVVSAWSFSSSSSCPR
jgi:hypothetical protein